jgi:hypothetical protein
MVAEHEAFDWCREDDRQSAIGTHFAQLLVEA